jgi:hypothetical protein
MARMPTLGWLFSTGAPSWSFMEAVGQRQAAGSSALEVISDDAA